MIKRFKAGKWYIYLGNENMGGKTVKVMDGRPHKCTGIGVFKDSATFKETDNDYQLYDDTLKDFYRLKKVTAFETGKYYVWIGPETDLRRECQFWWDKKPHRCRKKECDDSRASFDDSTDPSMEWIWPTDTFSNVREIKGYTGPQEDSTTQALMKDIDFGCNEPQVKALVDRLVKHIKEASLEK